MSEEGLLNVEDDGQEPAAPVAAAADAPPIEGQPPAEPADDVADAVDVGGQRMVPVSAVISERQRRQAAETRAARADENERYVNEARPWIEFLRANPEILKQRQTPAAPAAPAGPVEDPEAVQMATLLDLYTPEGKPDVARGRTFLGLVDKTADKRTQAAIQQHVAPIHQQTHQDRSAQNFYTALKFKDANGRSPSAESLAAIWRSVPVEQSSDQNVAAFLTASALGMDYAQNKPMPAAVPRPAGAPPIVTEGPSGNARPVALSALESRVAKDRGVTAEKWAENTQGFVRGRAQSLED